MVVISLAGQHLARSARHQYLHPTSLLVKLMMSKTQRAIRRSCLETLNGKEDKKWPPFMHLFDHNFPLNISRKLRTMWDFFKGKRSISDHVHQTVNYIKHLQSNIQELHNKRDRLKRSCDISCSSSTSTAVTMENSLSPMKESVVLVRPCKAGVEVVVNTPMKQRLALARLLEILKREGLSTISCISAQVNEKLIYTIESQGFVAQVVNTVLLFLSPPVLYNIACIKSVLPINHD
ncbi:unnamed protein product [Prunus armeniaca]|uniref:BHLH domain-containing protein n=1 Tax=Prunus armeniaca TaxID=36596 RepID=A0A6J5V138_PRUAR|nr:unnamed protein product [Prunus armeniaca]CAB4310207.1 unnamed protein product [Prunus armeniaca]